MEGANATAPVAVLLVKLDHKRAAPNTNCAPPDIAQNHPIMAEPLHVLLGANGDLCAMLPWLKTEAARIGRPVPLLVAKDYAPLLEGVSYVQPTLWPGTFVQLTAALRFLKTDLPELPVRVLQPIARMEDRTFPSFVHEMWYQAGALMQWGKLPLEFDRRDPEREAALVGRLCQTPKLPKLPKLGRVTHHGLQKKPMILVATKGKSSPFRYAKELMACIRAEFGKTHQVVDLSKVKAHRFYDLLGLYDQAAALVSIDTGHVHLSRASTVPTLVLARDYPQLWDGVPYEPRFAFYCRYGQWKRRKGEMLRVLADRLAGRDSDIHSYGMPVPGYNPAIMGGLVTTRVHLPHDWMTRLLANGAPLHMPHRFRDYSHEDMRLFRHGRKLMASCTLARKQTRNRIRCITVFGEMRPHGAQWRFSEVIQPAIGSNNWKGMEKNWIFFSDGFQIYCIYGIHAGEQVVLELSDRGRIISERRSKAPRWAYGEVRGGSAPLPHPSGHLIRFFHSRTKERGAVPFRYHIGALLMENKAPFKTVKITKHPLLSGTEEWMPGVHHWKPNVVFPCGALADHDHYIVTYGVNDADSRDLRVPHSILKP